MGCGLYKKKERRKSINNLVAKVLLWGDAEGSLSPGEERVPWFGLSVWGATHACIAVPLRRRAALRAEAV